MLDSERDFRWFYGSAISFGLAFMVKSWHALCIPAICLAYVLCNRRKKELTWKHAGLLLLAGFAPVLPWMAARFMRDGVTFLLGTVTTDVMQRVSDMQMGTALEYPRYLLSQPMLVVSLTLSGAAYALLRFGMREKLPDGSRAAVRGCLLWLLVPPILYSFSSFKMYHYVFSSLTAGSVLLGVTLHALYLSARKKPDWRRGALGVLTAVACAVGIG